jgi:hypothetical protein
MRTRFLWLGVVVLVVGCGGSNHASVSGTVTLDGQPLPNAVVNFQPTGAELNPGPGSYGRTNNKGEYTLQVAGGGSGAVLGWHRVTIRAGGEGDAGAPKVNVLAKYNSKTELKFEVKSGANIANFDLKSK